MDTAFFPTLVWPEWQQPMTEEEWIEQSLPDMMATLPFIAMLDADGRVSIRAVAMPFLYTADGILVRPADPSRQWPIEKFARPEAAPIVNVTPYACAPASWPSAVSYFDGVQIWRDIPIFSLVSFIAIHGGIDKVTSLRRYRFLDKNYQTGNF